MHEKSQFLDITGQAFNELEAIRCLSRKNRIWEWKCSCGNICKARKNDVVSGRKKSCGHLVNKTKNIVKIGDKYGEWEVLEYNIKEKTCLCRCSCGLVKEVHVYDLISMKSKSCGHATKGAGIHGRKDITGKQIGKWQVGEYIGNGYYMCTCSCGTTKKLKGTYLRTGQSLSCGCRNNKFKDLTGKKINEWQVIRYIGNSKFECKCSCGETRNIFSYDLTHNKTTNCGHERRSLIEKKKFGQLVAERYIGNNLWECKCSCGNVVNILTSNLISGGTKSCGCLREIKEEKLLEAIKEEADNYTNTNKQQPFPEDIADKVGVTPTTIRKYIAKYKLNSRFNLHFGSRYERDIFNFCKQFNDNVISRDREIIAPLELDVYIPNKKIAIEFNGNYWHNSDRIPIKYHQEKTIACAKKGIQLIHIFEYEWNDEEKQEKIKQIIKSKISEQHTIIDACNTTLKLVSNEETKGFINKYHLQGYSPASINLGLYYDKLLVSILSFACLSSNDKYDYEIIGYCNKFGYNIICGIEKQFSYFIDTYNPKSILACSDLSKFTGNTYSHIGFKPIHSKPITEPNCVLVSNETQIVLNSEQLKGMITHEELLTEIEENDEEIIKIDKFLKIYDCGNIRMEWTR